MAKFLGHCVGVGELKGGRTRSKLTALHKIPDCLTLSASKTEIDVHHSPFITVGNRTPPTKSRPWH